MQGWLLIKSWTPRHVSQLGLVSTGIPWTGSGPCTRQELGVLRAVPEPSREGGRGAEAEEGWRKAGTL